MTAGEPAVFDIGHTSTTPPDLVADVANGVKQIFPTTDIRLVCARDAQLLSHIFDASIDLGLIVEPPPDPHVGSLRLRTWHAGVLMRWDDPLASSPELKLSDFIDNRFVLTGPGRWPSAMKTVEAQLVAAGIHDFDYTDDFLEIGWQVANRNAFGLGVVERAPITDVYQALGLISRLALGLEVTSHTALVWSTEWAKQDPGFGQVVAALHALEFGLSDHPGHGLGSRSVI
jgi:DNA-binding transcriptional LysR family regulator